MQSGNHVGVVSRASVPIGNSKVFITLESSTSIDPLNPTTEEQRREARAKIWEETNEDLQKQILETVEHIKKTLG